MSCGDLAPSTFGARVIVLAHTKGETMHYRDTKAFTLIELLVVIVILAILLAIAVPSYINQQKKAHDAKAETYLNYAYRSAKAATLDNNDQWPTGATLLSDVKSDNPPISVVLGTGPGSTDVVEMEPQGDTLILYAHSESGTDWQLVCNVKSGCGQGATEVATLTDAQVATNMLNKVAAAAASYNTANGSYTGMSPAALMAYDPSIDAGGPLHVIPTSSTTYCADYTVNGTSEHVDQTDSVTSGLCP